MTAWLTDKQLSELLADVAGCFTGQHADAFEIRALVDEVRARRKIDASVNDAINRAGIHCAVTYAEAIDTITSARDEARAAARLLTDPPIAHETRAIEDRTAEAIAAWIERFASKNDAAWLAGQIRRGRWRKP